MKPVLPRHRHLGGAGHPTLVILHGLMGSSRNWTTAGRGLTGAFDVYAMDLRNHGDSPHVAEHSYPAMTADLVAWLDREGIDRAALLGHSMGGKVAMATACRHPGRVSALYVADISPKAYQPHYDEYLRAMADINLDALESREAAEAALEPLVERWAMRKFLLTNLVRDEATGAFRWQIHIRALLDDYDEIVSNPLGEDDRFDGPSAFIRGGNSPFIEDTDRDIIKGHFPRAQLITLKNAGHNLHVEQRETFVKTVLGIHAHFEGKGSF